MTNYPVFHVKHGTFVEGSGDGLPDTGRERWDFSGVKWSGADPDVVTLYCAKVYGADPGRQGRCRLLWYDVSLYQYMSLIVMSDYFSNVCSVGCFSALTLYFAKVPC